MTKEPYTKAGRLGDVLALIQMLAFDPDTHRSESGIIEKELGPPTSSTELVALHAWGERQEFAGTQSPSKK